MATMEGIRGVKPTVFLQPESSQNPFATTNAERKKIFGTAHGQPYDPEKCDELMAQFLAVFSVNDPIGKNYIHTRDFSQWFGDGTTPISQHFWKYFGSHTNPSWQYQNILIIQELSATQLPHFIAGLRTNQTELVGRWTGDAYVFAVLQQAITHGSVNRETLSILEGIIQEIEAQYIGVVPDDCFDRKAVRESELLAIKGLLSSEVHQKLLEGQYALLPFHSTSMGAAVSDNSRELTLKGSREAIEELVRKFLFKEVTEGDSDFGPQIDDRKTDWMTIWLEKMGQGYTIISVQRKDVPTVKQSLGNFALKLTEEQATECQRARNATEVVFNVRAILIDQASRKIFDIIQKSS